MLFGLSFAVGGLILAIASTQVPWLTFGRTDERYFTEFQYYPFDLKFCDYKGECKPTYNTACNLVKEAQSSTKSNVEGNFCALDQDFRGLTITTIVFGSISVVCILLILAAGKVATKGLFYVSIGSSLLATLMAVGAIGVCDTMKSVPLFSKYNRVAPSNRLGFILESLALILFVFSAFLTLMWAKSAPSIQDLQVVPASTTSPAAAAAVGAVELTAVEVKSS
ncbi:hypothetical protein HDU97_004955 [Phlyctochytrium planicorne]|nr:hypothetical protein HDU97_004955 [Phlyctochytrium planicorne]